MANATNQNTNANEWREGVDEETQRAVDKLTSEFMAKHTYRGIAKSRIVAVQDGLTGEIASFCSQCLELTFIDGVCSDGCGSEYLGDDETHFNHLESGFDHRDCPCSECRDYYAETDPTDLDVVEFVNILSDSDFIRMVDEWAYWLIMEGPADPELPELNAYKFPIKLSDQFIMTCNPQAFENRQLVNRFLDAVGNRKITPKTSFITQPITNPIHDVEHIKNYKCSACPKVIREKVAPVQNLKKYEVDEIGSASVVRDLSKSMMSVNVSSLDAVLTADRFGDRPIVKMSEIEYIALLDRSDITESYLDTDLIDDFAEMDLLLDKEIISEAGIKLGLAD